MTEQATLTPSFADLLPAWVAKQRWFAAKGRVPQLSRVGGLRLQAPDGEVGIEVHLVADVTPVSSTLYQIPLTYRSKPAADLAHALVGEATHSELGRLFIYDGCHDAVFATALLALVTGEERATSDDGPARGTAQGHRQPGAGPVTVTSASVLKGEQSNTSVIIQTADSRPLIAKVFRVLHEGLNPDVVIQSALADSGCALVPRPVGALSGSWPTGSGMAHGHLAFVQEFLPGVQDAWRVAAQAIADGVDFADRARALGAATAEVHVALTSSLETSDPTPELVAATTNSFANRLASAVTEVPALATYASDIQALYARAADAHWPRLQRIHGDYHLGQVLDVPGRGWVLLDFEGEPLRPLSERSLPDLALRDVAGMLRSFDYAAGSWEQAHPGAADPSWGARWAASAREAFLAGYAEVAGRDPRQDDALLTALEVDKALYEVVYEARNRPTWLGIPTTAITRLLSAQRSDPTVTTTSSTPRRPAGPAKPVAKPVGHDELDRLIGGWHHDPHSLLGPHVHEGGLTLRALKPMASRVWADLVDGSKVEYAHEHEGVWTAVLDSPEVVDYRLHVEYGDGIEHGQDDPYRFLPTLGEVDLHLIREGRHEELWKVLGAHVRSYDTAMGTVSGTSFAVWAPNARAVRLVGDFNHWDGQAYPMRSLGSAGIWELFVPGIGVGTRYKFEILGSDGYRRSKADPMARATEPPPATASVVTESTYAWSDEDWMTQRAQNSVHKAPMSVYEVHIGSWRQNSSYRDLAEHLTNYVKDLGFTHVEFLPVAEHPYGPSWGYQVTGFYAPTARFGFPDDFRYLVDTMHQNGIGVIVDWVPGHFPKDAFALARFDGQALYEHPDPRRGDQPDWGTHVFDFGRNEVRNFLVANALYWLEEFHVDGLRVDAVASMLYLDYSRKDGEWAPNQYGGREHLEAVQMLQETNATAYKRVPGVVMIAEESTSWPGVTRPTHLGGLGFGLKWNMGWMHDSLQYAQQQPIYRQYHHHEMTFSMVYAWSENFILPISHDEVVHGKGSLLAKMPGDRWQKLAHVRAFLAHMWAHPGKQLLFMGCEFGQEAEWADGRSLDWWLLDQPAHLGVHQLVKQLNTLYAARPAFWTLDESPEGFQWIDANDAGGNTFSFLRFGSVDENGTRPVVAAVTNFSGGPHYSYRMGLPHKGRWFEVLNTDVEAYGGSGVGNLGSVIAEEVPWHGQPYSAVLTLPPIGALWLEPESVEELATADVTPEAYRYPPVGDAEEDPAEWKTPGETAAATQQDGITDGEAAEEPSASATAEAAGKATDDVTAADTEEAK